MTADEVDAFREALQASLRGFVMPTAYGVGVIEGDAIRFPIVNRGGSHYLPAVVLASVLGYRSGSCAIRASADQLRQSVAKLAPVEACTDFKHPNLWAWRELLQSSPNGEFVAVFVGDVEGGRIGEAEATFAFLPGNTD